MKGRDFLCIADLETADVKRILDKSSSLKREPRSSVLEGKNIALVFQKPSLRTRASFDIGMNQLGGHSVYLSPAEVGLGNREPASDVARVLSRYADAIVARVFSQRDVEMLAEYSTVPVINALSDEEHPCQALADLLTIREKKSKLEGVRLAFIGDGNNVSNSLMLAASLAGMEFTIAVPEGFEPEARIVDLALRFCSQSGGSVTIERDPYAAAHNADVVYTDVWTSMGQEAETERRRIAFSGFCVDLKLMSVAKKDAIIMHDLPAHRGEEIADEAIESSQSVIFDQAENRLHVHKAILVDLLA